MPLQVFFADEIVLTNERDDDGKFKPLRINPGKYEFLRGYRTTSRNTTTAGLIIAAACNFDDQLSMIYAFTKREADLMIGKGSPAHERNMCAPREFLKPGDSMEWDVIGPEDVVATLQLHHLIHPASQ